MIGCPLRCSWCHDPEGISPEPQLIRGPAGDRVAALGGVDVDKLARMDGASLRAYIRGILARCVPGGRFALGSGNSVANFVPVQNYCIMLDESRRW